MPRTHEDSYGFLKIQNWTKTQQDTDIFVLQIAEQTFQICSYFPTKAASKIEPLCSQQTVTAQAGRAEPHQLLQKAVKFQF